jgi:hypothetical protein
MHAIIMAAPFFARALVVSLPIPLSAPVIRTVLPCMAFVTPAHYFKTWTSGAAPFSRTVNKRHGPFLFFCPEKPVPLGQVRVLRLCLGVLCLKSQIPSTKSQINLKFQYSMTKTFQGETLFGFSNFGHWNLFVICNLIFGISISQ